MKAPAAYEWMVSDLDLTSRNDTADDLTAAVDVWNEAQSERLGVAYVSTGMLELVTKRLVVEDAAFLIIEESGGTVGFALASPAREDDGTGAIIPGLAHISAVAIKSNHWGRGVGRRLMNAVVQELRCRGYRGAQLWTQTSNSRALRLYLSLGFVFMGDEKEMLGETIRRYRLFL